MLCHLLSILIYLTPTISSSKSDGLLSLGDVTTLRETLNIDPRFSLEIGWGRSTLPGMSVLMNAVHAMADLALEDFYEPLVPIAYSLDTFPEVSIAPKATAPGGAIQTRFIVWGLYQGIAAMTRMKKSQTATFILKWEATIVGYISVVRPRAQLSGAESNDTESLLRRPKSQGSNRIEEIAQNPPNATHTTNDHSLTVSFIPTGPALTGYEVLITVLYALAYAAQYPSAQAAEAFKLHPSDARDMYLGVVGSITAPFFQYRGVIETLDKIPRYMLYQGRFSGVTFRMFLGGVEVGQGQMFKAT